MHLGQIQPNGGVIAAVFEDGGARPIPAHTMVDLISRAEAEGTALSELAAHLASRHAENRPPVLPVHPREIWACGCTYESSAASRDAESGTASRMHGYVYEHDRPEIYFKGTARMCVGPGRPLGIRADSRFTVPEPELAVVLGSGGRIVGYTIANGAAARDIERENPLYRTQARSYQSSCALGPVIVTADQLPEPYRLEMSCAIERDGKVVFSGSVATASLHRRLDALIAYLLRSNPVPPGSVLLTGTGIIVPEEAALRPGDVVRVRIPEIGELSNPTAVV